MKFALNYSPAAARLYREHAIPLDLFKLPNWQYLIDEAARIAPVYVHFDLVAGGCTLDQTDWDAVEHMLAMTNTAWVNIHLAPRAACFPDADPDRVTDAVIADVCVLVARFGAERVVAENIPYQGAADGYDFVPLTSDPAFVRRVIDETGCGFLFDLSHARLAAWYLGVDERAYVEALPLDALRELHLTGIAEVDGRQRDHLHMSAADWHATEWAFERIAAGAWRRPELVAYEYGGVTDKFAWRTDPDAMRVDVPRLYALTHGR